MTKKVIIIGSGFSSLSAACYLAKQGHEIKIFEKNESIGGRARQLKKNGFTFDMGPTFYWMPDILESFFNDFGKHPSDFYQLIRLDPGYKVYFGKEDFVQIGADLDEIYKMFENEESGSSLFLKKLLKDAHFNYDVAINKVVYKPGKNIMELIMPATAMRVFQFIESISHKVRKNIKSNKLRQILEFPVLFLGAKPSKTPAFYCFMNYADLVLGTWHIKGGMFELVRAMQTIIESYNIGIEVNSTIDKIVVENGVAKGVLCNGIMHEADIVISGADYHHTECLLDKVYRNYTEDYWQSKTFAPSALLYYVGFAKKFKNVSHHTLFFDTDFDLHAQCIYDKAEWPSDPLFYASFPSITDSSMAPKDQEIAIFLIPIAPGLKDSEILRQTYFDQLIERLERLTNQSVKESVLFYESYATSNFVKDYNAYKGNAYGLANILTQTAFLKPKMQNKKVKNLFYTGQLTVPGPGVPPAIISGKIVSQLANSYLKK
ncbi:MAG: phytoene desaturase [Bacteroidota bacterium]|jgi:phytoene desaturase